MSKVIASLFRTSLIVGATSLALFGCSNESADETASAAEEETSAAVAPADPESFPDVVAKVNDAEIRKAELLTRAESLRAQVPPTEDTVSIAFFERVLDDLVSAELLFQASEEADLVADSAAMDEQLETLRARFPDQATFEQALASQGMSLDVLKAEMKRDMSIQNFIQTEVDVDVAVSEEQARRFYDENAEQMRQPDRIRLSHILKRVAPDATPETKAAARAQLQTLLEEAKSGADFAALAREHSEDPGSAQNGGELTVGRGETVPPFEQAAFALEPEGLSDVVETQFGFHIIKLAEKMEGQLVPFEQAKPRIEGFLKQQAAREAVAAAVETLKQSANVEVFIG